MVERMKCAWARKVLQNLRCALSIDRQTGKEEDDEKRKPKGWKCMPYIIGNETFEKIASTGLTSNFTLFLVQRYNMQQVVAANLSSIFFGTLNLSPLFGAFISDAYWGRFRTLAWSNIFSMLGMLVMTLSVCIPHLQPPQCSNADRLQGLCKKASNLQFGVLYLALSLLIIGAGGIRPCNLPFGVDQFDKSTEKGKLELNSFFNWYYFTTSIALVVAMTFIVYIQSSISWVIGFTIPTALMLLSLTAFFLGTKHYIYIAPEGSIFSSIAQVFVAAFKKRNLQLPSNEEQKYSLYNSFNRSGHVTRLHLTMQFRCLNKAAIISEGDIDSKGTAQNPWRLSSVQEIEEVKCVLRIIPLWASGIVCFLAVAQQFTFTTLQALTMDRHIWSRFEIAPASVGTMSLISLSIFIPIYDRLIIPLLKKVTKSESGLTLLQRQGVGIIMSVFSMVVAALVEKKRRESKFPLPVLWLAPQLVLMGVAEAFNAIGQIEFYNRQFPEHLQTLGSSLFFCTMGGASYLSSFTTAVVRKVTRRGGRKGWLNDDIDQGRLDLFYYVIAVMGVLNFVYFAVCSSYYRYKGERVDHGKEETVKETEIA